MKPIDYSNHSGGAQGADMTWDEIGKKYGFETHIHWRPEHLSILDSEGHNNMLRAYIKAAEALKRPHIFKYMEYCQRNWFQAHHSEAVFAISYIIAPGDKDKNNRKNETDRETVAGGTGWAVEMAIQMGKPVNVFDMNKNKWYHWGYASQTFVEWPETPWLTETYAGIGARVLTKQGREAIEEVYKKTLQLCSMP